VFGYHLELALRSFRRQPGHAALGALVLGVGVGMVMTVAALVHVLDGDPVPARSGQLLHVAISENLDNPDALDVMPSALVDSLRQAVPGATLVAGGDGNAGVQTDDGGRRSVELIRFTDPGIFALFGIPMLHGRPWSAGEAGDGAPVAVVTRDFAREMFDGADATGRALDIAGTRFRIVGVMDDWQPVPRFYDLSVGAYAPPERIFVPTRSVQSLDTDIFMVHTCPRGEPTDFPARAIAGTRCAWLNAWTLAPTPGDRRQLEAAVSRLVADARDSGLLPQRTRMRIENVRELLDRANVVPGGAWLGLALATGFLLLCMANAAGLLLARCLRDAGEIGIRRALGASRRNVVAQILTEQALLGIGSSLIGILVACGGVALVRQLPDRTLHLAALDPAMLAMTLAVAIGVGVLSGVVPAWRASLVEPAIQAKADA
jgi:putative ABC transport system permease protein